MDDNLLPSVADTERVIRSYLQAHPHAVDTDRGIREWWLQNLEPPASAATVRAAIERLLARRELSEVTLPDGQVAYAISRVAANPPPDRP